MFKRLLFALVPAIYLMIYPIRAEDFFDKELKDKTEVYHTSKNHMQLFLNGDKAYLDSFSSAGPIMERLQEFYDSKEFGIYLKGKLFDDVFQMNLIYILSYRELMGVEQIKDRYSRILVQGDYFVVFPLQEKFRGILPPVMVFMYRKNADGEWKIVQNVVGM